MPKGSRGSFSSEVYTASGTRVRNPEAYARTGAPTYTRRGRPISDPVAYSGAIEASVRQNTAEPKYLFHYTSSDSLGKIRQTGHIQPSSSAGDCALGSGVYFTAKQPRASSDGLLKNNYDGAGGAPHRVEAYVRVDADKVNGKSGRTDLGRDVFVVPGAVNLEKANAKAGYRQ